MEREPSLEEVAYLHGMATRAGKEWRDLQFYVNMLNTCKWWEFIRKAVLKRKIIAVVRSIQQDALETYYFEYKKGKGKLKYYRR